MAPDRGWLFNNGRFLQSYDELGACLGSGGMGRVWAAHVGPGHARWHESASSSSSCRGGADAPGRAAGSWVAVKAIPVELAEDECTAGNLQIGLRECLSTFRDLSHVHVVRYDSYWVEEQEHLPVDMRRFWEPDLALKPQLPQLDITLAEEAPSEEEQPLEECPNSPRSEDSAQRSEDSDHSKVSSRFAGDGDRLRLLSSEGPGARLERTMSTASRIHDLDRTPVRATSLASVFSECGFVFEQSATPAVNSTAALPNSTNGEAPLRRCEDRAVARAPNAPRASTNGTAKGQTKVVLLIEMELMGSIPGRAEKSDAEQRLTLRAWLQRCGPPFRTFSDAADVFGMLMLSVRHIHRKRLVHADLKPDNIFLVTNGQSKVTAVKIGDFGLAGENQLFRQIHYSESLEKVVRKSLPAGGTPGYLAPELLSQESPCSDKADIFACAVILLEVLLPPFGTHMERTAFLDGFRIRNAVPEFLEVRLPKTRALLRFMGAEDPACRLSAEEVCKKFEKDVRKELCRLSIQRCASPSVFRVEPARRRADSSHKEGDADNTRAAKGKRRGKQRRQGKQRKRGSESDS